MAAIACHPYDVSRAPLRLLSGRPAGRPSPSVAARRRAAGALVALVALGFLLGVGSLAGAGRDVAERSGGTAPTDAAPIAAAVHVVQPGDTIWSLARLAQPEGDVRPLVARLHAEHGPGPLVPGERLRLAV